MTASPLICARCGREIAPGTAVEFVGADPDVWEQRIFLDDELLVVHATCDSDDQ